MRRRAVRLPALEGSRVGSRNGDGMAQRAELPKQYYLDESDPDVVVLYRKDGTLVAVFSARGATREGLVEAAREDYAALIRKSA